MFNMIPYDLVGGYFYRSADDLFLSKNDIKLAMLVLNTKSYVTRDGGKFNPETIRPAYLLKTFSYRYVYSGDIRDKIIRLQKQQEEYNKLIADIGSRTSHTLKEKFLLKYFINQKLDYFISSNLYKKILNTKKLNKKQILIILMFIRFSQNFGNSPSNLKADNKNHHKVTTFLRLFDINITQKDIKVLKDEDILKHYHEGIFMFNSEYIYQDKEKENNVAKWENKLVILEDFFKNVSTTDEKWVDNDPCNLDDLSMLLAEL